jgi:hypothetical protein
MSLNFTQITSLIDENCKTDSTSYTTAKKTVDVNVAIDKVLSMIFSVGGTWQFDDSNHTDYPIITTDLVSGQRDYTFTQDGSSNLILEIYRVAIADENGNFFDVFPVDVESREAPLGYIDGIDTEGMPITYDKLGNGIFLDPIPNYNATGGVKIYINREASYFDSGDTTKKAGFAGIFHEYLVLRPSYQFAYRNGKANAQVLQNEMLRMEEEIKEFYQKRSKDEVRTITGRANNSR